MGDVTSSSTDNNVAADSMVVASKAVEGVSSIPVRSDESKSAGDSMTQEESQANATVNTTGQEMDASKTEKPTTSSIDVVEPTSAQADITITSATPTQPQMDEQLTIQSSGTSGGHVEKNDSQSDPDPHLQPKPGGPSHSVEELSHKEQPMVSNAEPAANTEPKETVSGVIEVEGPMIKTKAEIQENPDIESRKLKETDTTSVEISKRDANETLTTVEVAADTQESKMGTSQVTVSDSVKAEGIADTVMTDVEAVKVVTDETKTAVRVAAEVPIGAETEAEPAADVKVVEAKASEVQCQSKPPDVSHSVETSPSEIETRPVAEADSTVMPHSTAVLRSEPLTSESIQTKVAPSATLKQSSTDPVNVQNNASLEQSVQKGGSPLTEAGISTPTQGPVAVSVELAAQIKQQELQKQQQVQQPQQPNQVMNQNQQPTNVVPEPSVAPKAKPISAAPKAGAAGTPSQPQQKQQEQKLTHAQRTELQLKLLKEQIHPRQMTPQEVTKVQDYMAMKQAVENQRAAAQKLKEDQERRAEEQKRTAAEQKRLEEERKRAEQIQLVESLKRKVRENEEKRKEENKRKKIEIANLEQTVVNPQINAAGKNDNDEQKNKRAAQEMYRWHEAKKRLKAVKSKDTTLLNSLCDDDKSNDLDKLISFHVFYKTEPGETNSASADRAFQETALNVSNRVQSTLDKYRNFLFNGSLNEDLANSIVLGKLFVNDQKKSVTELQQELSAHQTSAAAFRPSPMPEPEPEMDTSEGPMMPFLNDEYMGEVMAAGDMDEDDFTNPFAAN